MTDEQILVTTPQIQVVLPTNETRTVSFADIAIENDHPATISDSELLSRLTRYWDSEFDFANYKVTRPSSGNILVSREFRYG